MSREQRRKAVCAWIESIGLDPDLIPMHEGSIVATPINEGELLVTYEFFDPRILNKRIPLSQIVDEDRRVPTNTHEMVVSEAPPGFELPSWDGCIYMFGRVPVMPYPVSGGAS